MKPFFFVFTFLFAIQSILSDEINYIPKTVEDVEEYAKQIDFETTPNAVVAGVVNVITGNYFEAENDFTTVGANPFTLSRYFSSGEKGEGELYDLWDFNISSKARTRRFENIKIKHITVFQGNSTLFFRGKFNNYISPHSSSLVGITNIPSPYLSGKEHMSNKRANSWKNGIRLVTPGGDVMDYFDDDVEKDYFYLSKVTKPDGCAFKYYYGKDKFARRVESIGRHGNIISSFDVQRKKIDDIKTMVTVKADDGRELNYRIIRQKKHLHCLTKVESNFGPPIRYIYDGKKLEKKELPDSRFLKICYKSNDKVSELYAPVGFDEKPVLIYKFNYSNQAAEVTDANGNKKKYKWTPYYRLTEISDLTKKGDLYRTENLDWNNTCLASRSMVDAKGNILFAKTYKYDNRKNILQECLLGNISGTCSTPIKLDGNEQCEKYIKNYTYSEDNLVLSESDGFQKIIYSYYPKTSLLSQKIVLDENEIIRQRFMYVYDRNGAKTIEVVDDGNADDMNNLNGITERRITRYKNSEKGLPIVILENYTDPQTHEEKCFKRTLNTYNQYGLREKEEVYDSFDQFMYAKEWKYDPFGKVIEETDPAGLKTSYTYDGNGNMLTKQTPNPDYYTAYQYDFSNRLIKEEEIYSNRTRLAKSYSYDFKGNKTRATDIYGNVTEFVYDEYDRIIQRILPPTQNSNGELKSYKETIEYNELNHPIRKYDADGYPTTMSVNIYGKPYLIKHPSYKEEATYYLNGLTKTSTDANGVKTHFEYDCFQRKTKEEKYSPEGIFLSSHQWIYNTFRLLKEIDHAGKETTYTYDMMGLLVSESCGDSLITYFYDTLGRQIEKREHLENGDYRATIFNLDVKGQILEEKIQDCSGQIFLKKQYTYDAMGNRTQETVCTSSKPSTTSTKYNSHGKPTKILSPDGSETIYIYRYDYVDKNGLSVPFEQIIDPKGNSVVKIYDTHDNLALEECRNPLNEVAQRTKYLYDPMDRLMMRIDEVIVDGNITKSIKTAFEYDLKGREIGIIEAYKTPEQKITRKEYNHFDEVKKLYKPDGIVLYYDYDLLGRLLSLRSSDGSIHYKYSFDKGNNIIEAIDMLSGHSTLRNYDANNRMTSETLESGLKFNYTYDKLGRLKNLTLPDQTEINYGYDAGYLKAVSRTKNNQTLTHTYEYDTSGKRIQAELPGNLGVIKYDYDACLRISGIQSTFWQMQSLYDFCGNATQVKQKDPKGDVVYRYEYDSLNQLTNEEGTEKHAYRFDSIGNRVEKDAISYENNSLNQLKKQNDIGYTYDSNGCLLEKCCNGLKTNYAYDALGRLAEVSTNTQKTVYKYDPFHRRMSKTSYVYDGIWKEASFEQYLYQADKEIGAANKNGEVFQLRIMGTGCKGDVGAAVLMELNGNTYIPLHDYRGNVCVLLNTSGHAVETYRYTAYGEETVFSDFAETLNPWRFSSKRVDPETGWSYFGSRHYDPETGRWTTPDPLWFVDGPNLYAFVKNQPTKFIDPEGLFLADLFSILARTVCSVFEFIFNLDYSASIDPKSGWTIGIANNKANCKGSTDRRSCTLRRYPTEYGPVYGVMENGIFTSMNDAKSNCDYLTNAIAGMPVHCSYNASHGLWDLVESFFGLLGMKSRPVKALQQEWDNYFNNCPEGGIIIHYCHSQGAIITRNALESYPPELRNRIHVIAVAPAAYIGKELCGSVMHYISDHDIVPQFDRIAQRRCRDTIAYLKRAPGTSALDHSFKSPTYKKVIKDRTNWIVDNFGGIRK